ncbi:MAG: sodium:calcium antiporter [Nitriliruptoraceae bacterium]
MAGTWSLPIALAAFTAATVVIALAGTRLARVVDRLADRTGLGEAVAGAVLLGSATSLAGLTVSIVAAASNEPSVAISNSVGGIAVQTAFIVALDVTHRGANLERAAASLTNVFNALLLITLLGIVVLGVAMPPVTLLGVHPASMLLVVIYGYGLRLSHTIASDPMWHAERTRDTQLDEPDEPEPGENLARLWTWFGALAVATAASGWVVGQAGLSLIEETDLSGTFVAVVFTAVATSLPELITGIAAIRTGAPTLAVGGIIGGNTFDTLFIAISDVVYQRGSLYEQVVTSDMFVIGWTILLTGILGAGLIRRQRAWIGFEGFAILGGYIAGLGILWQL